MKTLSLLLAAACAALTFTVAAEKSGDSHELHQFKLGEHLFGPQVSLASAHGKAVLLDCWGIHCGPCLALMPEMEKISKRYEGKLMVVGVHSQENDKKAIEAVIKKDNITYPVVNNMNSPVQFSELPHAFIFDATGHMMFSGNPMDKDFDRLLRKAMETATASVSGTPSGLDALKPHAPGAPATPSGLDALKPLTPAASVQ